VGRAACWEGSLSIVPMDFRMFASLAVSVAVVTSLLRCAVCGKGHMNGCLWTDNSIRVTALFWNELEEGSHIY
jgi:hypothetical protein